MQTFKGKVVSNKMQKTVVVEVARLKQHPIYKKYIKLSARFKAHVEEPVEEGKTVIIESTKPISKNKKWRVVKIL